MLRFEVHKELGTREAPLALKAAGDLPAGGLGVLQGASGAGKSSLLKLLAGVMEGEKERISFDGRLWSERPQGGRLDARERDASLLFQDLALFPNMSVEANIRFAWPKERDPREMERWIREAGLEELRGRRPKHLSGGQQQRVGLLRVMAAHPSLLLLDEPFSAMDPKTMERMLQLLEAYRQKEGVAVLIATHDPLEERLAPDRSWEMEAGELEEKRPKEAPSTNGRSCSATLGVQHPDPSRALSGRTTGVILAGGRSRRMGQDKGLMEFEGKVMAQRSLELLTPWTDEQLIVANDPRYRGFGVPIVPDQWPYEGPLGGILTALMATNAPRIMVLPCDMPYMSEAVLEQLRDEAGSGISVISRGDRVEPLVGIYPRKFLESGLFMMKQGVRSVREAIELMPKGSVTYIEGNTCPGRDGKDPFTNLNHPPERGASTPLPRAGTEGPKEEQL